MTKAKDRPTFQLGLSLILMTIIKAKKADYCFI